MFTKNFTRSVTFGEHFWHSIAVRRATRGKRGYALTTWTSWNYFVQSKGCTEDRRPAHAPTGRHGRWEDGGKATIVKVLCMTKYASTDLAVHVEGISAGSCCTPRSLLQIANFHTIHTAKHSHNPKHKPLHKTNNKNKFTNGGLQSLCLSNVNFERRRAME